MRHPFGIILGVGLLWLAYTLFREAGDAYRAEVIDPTRVVVLFAEVVLVGLAAGIVFVTTFMPAVGEWVGNFLFNPNDEIEETLHTRAVAAAARGDYGAAIRQYAKAWKKDGTDVAALQSMSQLYCERLNDPNSALKTLESARNREVSEEVTVEIEALLAQVYWRHLHDPERARLLLQRIIEVFPNTKYSMNAQRTLEQMERELIRRRAEEVSDASPVFGEKSPHA